MKLGEAEISTWMRAKCWRVKVPQQCVLRVESEKRVPGEDPQTSSTALLWGRM